MQLLRLMLHPPGVLVLQCSEPMSGPGLHAGGWHGGAARRAPQCSVAGAAKGTFLIGIHVYRFDRALP